MPESIFKIGLISIFIPHNVYFLKPQKYLEVLL